MDISNVSMKGRLMVFLLAGFLLFEPRPLPATQAESQDESQGLELELKTNKTTYKAGERILVTLTLRNPGDWDLLAPKRLGLLCWDSGWDIASRNTELQISDAQGNHVRGPRGCPVADRVFGRRMPTDKFVEFIRRSHRVFLQGDFMGTEVPLQTLGYQLTPGRYRLKVLHWQETYDDLVSPKGFEAAKEELHYPWWARVESNSVEIEIQP